MSKEVLNRKVTDLGLFMQFFLSILLLIFCIIWLFAKSNIIANIINVDISFEKQTCITTGNTLITGDYNSTKRIIGKIDNNSLDKIEEYKNALFYYTPLTENL